jgi:hypothetical protein
MLCEIVLPSKPLSMSFASDNRADERRRAVNLPSVTSQISWVAEVFDFTTRDGTFVRSSMFVHVFPIQCLAMLPVVVGQSLWHT